ncbi:MAG: AAA family ATPase [Actinomycetia bacterium]|nr:AAA family ATPase [Actinomycetes bacterium]
MEIDALTVEFAPPSCPAVDGRHHADAAAGNAAVAQDAIDVLRDAMSGSAPVDRVLLKAAAGAGKSFVLRRLVADAVAYRPGMRIVVVAFANKQIHPLAAALGAELGQDRVCLFVAKDRIADVPAEARTNATVVSTTSGIPAGCAVVIATAHKLGAIGELKRLRDHLGVAGDGASPFDVLLVDEAWQLPHHLFDRIAKAAPVAVGVGDVGQLPPLEIGSNPWRGDPGFNPYRAWPTAFDGDERTWAAELPAVWRPAAGHLELWRAFYPEWDELHCVAAPGDRAVVTDGLNGAAGAVWGQVGTGVPTLLEVAGLPDAEAADVDLPLLEVVERLLDELLTCRFSLVTAAYDNNGKPNGVKLIAGAGGHPGDPLVAVLATRNQAVDDATDMVERLRAKHGRTETELVASTVDSWQGQTNGITVAIHPLTGAAELDAFNSAFGRLAVACTRATHGLLLVARPGLDELLTGAPARPGTPFGEPGKRHLPRQTHQRILAAFARGTLTVNTAAN